MENQNAQRTDSQVNEHQSSFGGHPLDTAASTAGGHTSSAVPFSLTAQPLGGSSSEHPDGPKQYALATPGTGVVQAKSSAPIQRQEAPINWIVFRINVPRAMSGEEFGRHADMQILGAVGLGTWSNLRERYTPADSPVTVRYDSRLLLQARGQANQSRGIPTTGQGGVTGAADRAARFDSQPGSEGRAAVIAEIDRRFYQATGARPGTLIRQGDEGNAQLWRAIRDEVLYQHEYLRNLPESVRLLIRRSTNGRPMSPADYDRLFQLARRIEGMPADQVLDYASRINGSTTDLDQFEASLNNYIRQRTERNTQSQERERLQTRLFGLEQVYRLYLQYKSAVTSEAMSAAMSHGASGLASLFVEPASTRYYRELESQLRRHGFESVSAFERFIGAYETAFERESAAIFDDTMARFEGSMYRQAERYQNQAELEAMQRLLQSGSADLASQHPIFHDEGLPDDRRIPRAAWARASRSQLSSLVQSYIATRIADIREARGRVRGDTRLIYKMDRMFPLFYQQQRIESGSIYDQIIREKMSNDAIRNLVVGILGAIVAIALTVISLGTATPAIVATVAAVGAFGVSGYFAYEEYQRYVTENNLANVGMMDDPSMVWVVIAVVGAAVDMGAAFRAVRALSPAARVLNETGDLAAFNQALRALEESSQLDARIADAVRRAASARAGAQQASGQLARVLGSRVYSFPGPFTDPDVYRFLIQMASARIRQGLAAFDAYVAELRQMRIAARLAEMSPEELAKVKEAWEQALILARSAETPVDILSTANRPIGRFSLGNQLEIISRSTTLHGSNTIALAPGRTTTITGTLADVNTIAERGARMPGVTLQGANPGAINILRSPRWAEIQDAHRALLEAGRTTEYWRTVTDEFWETVNRPWLEAAISRGDQIRLVSDPTNPLAVFSNTRGTFHLDEAGRQIRSIFGREVDLLRARGYTFSPEGIAIPPTR